MKKTIVAIAAAFMLSATAFAGEVKDGSLWILGDQPVSVDVTPSTPGPGIWVQGVDATGISSVANGVAGAHSTPAAPTASSSGEWSTGGNTYRIKDGKVQKKLPNGKWANMRPVKKKKQRNNQASSSIVQVGDEVVSLPND